MFICPKVGTLTKSREEWSVVDCGGKNPAQLCLRSILISPSQGRNTSLHGPRSETEYNLNEYITEYNMIEYNLTEYITEYIMIEYYVTARLPIRYCCCRRVVWWIPS